MITTSATTELVDFQRGTAERLERLTQSGGVEIVTIDGEPKGVVMSPAAYDRMADLAEQAEITEGLRRGFADLDAGRVMSTDQLVRRIVDDLGLDMSIVEGG